MCVATHCKLGDHEGIFDTKIIIQKEFFWPTLEANVHFFSKANFVALCCSKRRNYLSLLEFSSMPKMWTNFYT